MRVLIVGRGPRGRTWEGHVARRRGLRLAGTVDPDPAAQATWRALDTEALTAADAVVVASPPAMHAEHALACLDAGLAVLVEKPLALSVEDARAVADAARAAGRPVVVGQTFAERPLERAVAAALAELGPLRAGLIASARTHAATPAHLAGVRHAPLWDFAVHHFDLMRRRAGGVPLTVEAVRHGETYRASFRWASGVELGWWHDDGGTLFHRAEWWRGEGGAVEVQGERAWRLVEGRRPRRLRLPRGAAEDRLLDALAGGRSDVEGNVGTVAMLAAAEAALESGGAVDLATAAVAA